MRDTIRTKKIFFLDALGALITTLILGIVGFLSPSWFGFPQEVLLLLAGFAAVLTLTSSTFYLKESGSNLYLWVIISGNSLYCLITLAAIVHYFDSLTILGMIYFSVEIFIISVLIFLEYRTLNLNQTDE